jgi:hypothetical protein
MLLYRPVGLKELELIAATRFTAFPPRLPQQPIFYPVLNLEYAEQIARDWNTKDRASSFAGFVTSFEVDDNYLAKFSVETVGNKTHQELWIPAEELDEFNRHILGKIAVKSAYYGAQFQGAIDAESGLPSGIDQS